VVTVTQGVSKVDDIRQRARHVLFVEGETAEGFDVPVIEELLKGIIKVTPLGPSFSVKSTAEALFPHHPDYYFLVDRDHHDDQTVKQSWKRFPDPKTNNLLIWRRRELESYFLISSYLTLIDTDGADIRRIKTQDQIDEVIRKACIKRLFLDSANQVIAEVREQNKTKWIELFRNPSELPTREEACDKLVNHPAFAKKRKDFKQQTDRKKLKVRFDAVLSEMTGGGEVLEFGKGMWLERIRAKKIFNEVANKCFRVFDRNGQEVRGVEKAKQIALFLARGPTYYQPEDFQALYRLIDSRIGKTKAL
jgi:hypothetical protein